MLEAPPTRAMGDLACPVAFELARRLRKAPRAIAAEIVAALGPIAGVSQAEAAPNGYVNVFLDRAAAVRLALGVADDGAPAPEPLLPAEKTIVEHTAINPNKAAHIGHLRNATLGDTLVRLLRYGGVPVEVQNYIDDTGVQVADVVVGFEHLENKTLDEVRAIADSTRFDYYCWDLYARVTEWYDADTARLTVRSETLHAIEHGGNDTAALGAFIADRIVRAHLETMARLNVDYDLLTWEGDILRLKFWAHRLRPAARERHDVPADRGQARGLLGDADRRGSDRRRRAGADRRGEPPSRCGEASERARASSARR